jgi:hypothetical protein
MKLLNYFAVAATGAALFFSACQMNEGVPAAGEAIPQEVLSRIGHLGFDVAGVKKIDEGYLVEGDIVLTHANLDEAPEVHSYRSADEEQYHTFNLVTGTPRTINIFLRTSGSGALPTSYVAALDEAIARYNAENLGLSFVRLTAATGANITIRRGNGNYLASAGFPTGGNPYGTVLVNSNFIGSNPNTNYLATILAHEIGHCIGFRHTDWYNRAISCGGAASNEGQETTGVGAVHIPGTPDKTQNVDGGSWMLACIGSGQNRPFSNNDKTALGYLY